MATHVYALLGKALQAGQISRALRARAWTLIDRLADDHGDDVHLAICGGGGEAEAALAYLLAHGQRWLPPPSRRFLDRGSTTTVENMQALAGYLRPLRARHERLHLTIVSSPLHLERLLTVDRELPSASLLALVAGLCDDLDTLPAPDGAADHPRAEVRWLARAHAAVEALLPLQVNLEACPAPVPGLLARAHAAVATLDDLLAAPPEALARRHATALATLANCQLRLRDLDSLPLAALRECVAAARQACDPDLGQFDWLFAVDEARR